MYALNGGVAGQVLAERTVTAWSGSISTSWSDAWLYNDLMGNVTGWSTNAGVFTRLDRDAYGMPVAGASAQTPSGYGLTTKYRDPDSGLMWFGARWYDAETGRWLEPEPTGADGPNMYGYAWGCPTRFYDPTGLWSIDGDIHIGIGVSLGIGKDPQTGWFMRCGAGIGLGIGVNLNPRGGVPRPNSGPMPSSGAAAGINASVGAALGPVNLTGGYKTGGINPNADDPPRYGGIFVDGGLGFGAKAGASCDLEFYAF